MKILIFFSESPLKVRKIAVYRFLMSFLVLEFLRSNDLKNYRENRDFKRRGHEEAAVTHKIPIQIVSMISEA